MLAIYFILASIVVSFILNKPLLKMLEASGNLQKNYRGSYIPKSSGILIFLVLFAIFSLLAVINYSGFNKYSMKIFPLIFLITGSTLIGLIDDTLGNREFLGFKGHIKALKKGIITSGMIKAGGGILLACLVIRPLSSSFFEYIISVFVIALSMNLFNLLDLRPGRSLKYFILATLVSFAFSYSSFYWVFFSSITGPVIILLYLDLTEKAIIGDTGSNTIGSVFGLIIVANFSLTVKIVYLFLVIVFHIFTEVSSFTKLVENIKLLRWFDLLGRKYKN